MFPKSTHISKPLWRDRNLRLIFGVTLSAVMGVSLLTPVFPQVVEIFGINREQATLLITVFTLPGVLLSPLYGVLADRWGRKRLLVPLLLLFGIAGGACGFARNFTLLLVLRFLQGVGGGGLFTLNNTILGDLYEGEDRLKAIGFNSSVISGATAIYPAVGGVLAHIHWSAPFFLPAVAVIMAMLVLFLLRSPENRQQQALKGYLAEAYSQMISFRILRLFAISFITFALAMGVIISFVPFWMSEQYSAGPELIGMLLSISALSGAITSSQLMQFRRVMSVGWMIAMAFSSYAVALWVIPHCPSVWWMLLPSLLYGAGQGLNIPSVQSLIVSSAPMQYRGAFMATNSMVILFGISLGPVLGALGYNLWGLQGLFHSGSFIALAVFAVLVIWGRGMNIAQRQEGRIVPR